MTFTELVCLFLIAVTILCYAIGFNLERLAEPVPRVYATPPPGAHRLLHGRQLEGWNGQDPDGPWISVTEPKK